MAVLDIFDNIKHVIDAPPEALLACPVGLIAALHFASGSNPEIKGAKNDNVVRVARAEAFHRPGWIKALGIGLGLGVAGGNFIYIQDPTLLASMLDRLPF
jgi:hypothetical protein